ncbi:MAG: sigma-54 dependent transcriptional regulator [Pseudomonadota bacterium]
MTPQMLYPFQRQTKPLLLLIGEENNFCRALLDDLQEAGFLVRKIISGEEEQDFSKIPQIDAVVIFSSRRDPLDGIHYLELLKSFRREVPIFLVARYGSEEKAISALRFGATDYFSGSQPAEELIRSIKHHLHDVAPVFDVFSPAKTKVQIDEPDMVGVSPEIEEVRQYLLKVAGRDSTVLLTGETGTGKELAADFIHWHSKRRRRPLIRINSSAMPEQLVESELFGYEKGAFTGAVTAKAGKFEQANGGILFLDEIGEMSPFAQAKILRILENRRVYRLGSTSGVDIDVRIIAATNQDLEDLVDRGLFRKDLFFRLNVARVHLPPLRERRDDIPVLLSRFIKEFNALFGMHLNGFTEKAWFSLLKYDWPGNIRELRNILEATYINGPVGTITFDSLPRPFQEIFSIGGFKPKSERDQVLSALFAANWNKSKAADNLNWSRMTLYRKMAKHQIVQHRSVRTRLSDIRQ